MPILASAIYARIARANEHVKSLQTDIDAFCCRNAHDVRHEIDTETGEKIVVYYAREELPVTWSIVIGEIAQNLRNDYSGRPGHHIRRKRRSVLRADRKT